MKPERDEHSGVETTGHVWDDDLRELNTPLPRWWLTVFYACIVWAVGYWVVYPAWPGVNGYTKGMLGWSARKSVTQAVADDAAAHADLRQALAKTPLKDVRANEDLYRFATATGAAAFAANCAPCHGRGAQGAIGYPNLNDDDWLWGGTPDEIYKTIQFGIRSDHPDTHVTDMPHFGTDKILEAKQIDDAAEYVLSLSGKSTDQGAAGRGAQIFADNCAACHGEKGAGNKDVGAPNLSDSIWLYGGAKDDVRKSIETGRGGRMPAWKPRLDEATLRALTLYVASLGGSK